MAPRIIVVDDDLPTLALMHDLLTPAGYRVDCASTSEAGLCATRQECPALIILDLRTDTPDAGWRLLERLRADPATAAVPVIAYSTDHHALQTRHTWLRERNCATLAKPFDLDELLECIDAAVPAMTRPPGAPLYRDRHRHLTILRASDAAAPQSVGGYHGG